MQVKIVNGFKEHIYQCEDIDVTRFPDDGPNRQHFTPDQIGIEVRCCPRGPTLRIPRDGEVIYVMNDRGDTTNTYRYRSPVDAAASPASSSTSRR